MSEPRINPCVPCSHGRLTAYWFEWSVQGCIVGTSGTLSRIIIQQIQSADIVPHVDYKLSELFVIGTIRIFLNDYIFFIWGWSFCCHLKKSNLMKFKCITPNNKNNTLHKYVLWPGSAQHNVSFFLRTNFGVLRLVSVRHYWNIFIVCLSIYQHSFQARYNSFEWINALICSPRMHYFDKNLTKNEKYFFCSSLYPRLNHACKKNVFVYIHIRAPTHIFKKSNIIYLLMCIVQI